MTFRVRRRVQVKQKLNLGENEFKCSKLRAVRAQERVSVMKFYVILGEQESSHLKWLIEFSEPLKDRIYFNFSCARLRSSRNLFCTMKR